MSLRTDHSFHIGEQHLRQGKPCQDYALSGLLDENHAYAIVSDGCGSGGMTDIGSRLTALATKRAIEEKLDENVQIGEKLLQEIASLRDVYAEEYRQTLGIEHKDMLATSLFSIASDKYIGFSVTGDGAVALIYPESVFLYLFSWANNTPYYPAYKSAGTQSQFMAAHRLCENPYTLYFWDLCADPRDHRMEKTAVFDIEAGMRGFNLIIESSGSREGNTLPPLVALFSDGITQVQNTNTEEAVWKLINFKSTNGQFAVRRMNRFLQEAKVVGKGPIDDLAYSVISLSHQEEGG
jgi:hypothetical protein